MTDTTERRRIEVIVDAPLLKAVLAAAKTAGLVNYTLLPTLGGSGAGGRWTDDQVSGAQSKVLFVAVASEGTAQKFVDVITPMLDSHGLVLFLSSVSVVRSQKF